MKDVLKVLLKFAVVVLIFLVLIVGGYLAYVYGTYYRLEDNLQLEITHVGNPEGIGKLAPTGDSKTYTLTSWNIGFGAYTDDYSFFMDGGKYSRAISQERLTSNINDIVTQLDGFRSDFYLIQEVDTDATRSYHMNQLDALTSFLNSDKRFSWTFAMNYDSPYLFYPISEPHGKSKAGILTMSKYDIGSSLRRSLPVQDNFAKFYDLDRCYSINKITLDNGKNLVLINLHLSAYTTDPTIAQKQLEMLYADMVKEYNAGNYVICGGDFNKDLLGNSPEVFGVSGKQYSWAQPLPVNDIPEHFTLVAPLDKDNPVSSCRNADSPWNPATNFQVTVDGFIVSDNVKLLSSKVIDQQFKYSDHHPVQIEFSFVQ